MINLPVLPKKFDVVGFLSELVNRLVFEFDSLLFWVVFLVLFLFSFSFFLDRLKNLILRHWR